MTTPDHIPFTPIPSGSGYVTIYPLVNAILGIPEINIITPSPTPNGLYRAPTFIFVLKHSSGKVMLFDLGIRADWATGYQEDLARIISNNPPEVVGFTEKILSAGGEDPEKVESIFISHRHWDHSGDVAVFPNAEVVGGRDTFDGDLKHQIAGRKVLRLEFDKVKGKPIGAFENAYDYLGDGSIWLMDSAGHTAGHMSALVRTSPGPDATYVFLCGDTCHHPALISPEPHSFELATFPARLQPDGATREHPALPPPCCMHSDKERAWDTVQRTRRMEKEDNVMVVLAHDYVLWKLWKGEDGRLWPGKKGISDWKKEGLKIERKYDTSTYDRT